MSILARLKGKGPNGLGYASTALQATAGVELRGRTMLVTGCSSGLGRETIRVLALRGARVIATARTLDKARAACADLAGQGDHGGLVPLACDLSEPGSVRACVAAVERQDGPLDVLVCNAGIMALPRLTQKFGYELQFLTNHIGHFMLVNGLRNRMTAEGRIVVVASAAHRRAPRAGIELDNLSGARGYAPWKAYGQSKLANILFTKELARRAGDGGRTANALHPGVIDTNLNRSLPAVARLAMRIGRPLALKDAAQGAATQCYLATSPAVARVTGQYFADCNPAQPEPIANDTALAAQLWEASERIVASLP